MTRRATIAAAVLGLLIAGCGSTTHSTTTTATRSATTPTATAPTAQATLTNAVIAAVDADHKTSVTALWTNTVPPKPLATAGPALTTLRRSVAGRRAQGIRVRMLEDRFRVTTTTLDPSYTTATAAIIDVERVQPYHANGKPFGKPVKETERATLDLHRVAGSDQFVVWKVVTGQ